LEALAALGGMPRNALHAQLASALDAVVHIARGAGGRRRVREVSVLVRDPVGGLVHVEPAVEFGSGGQMRLGPGGPRLERLLSR
jgi:pilus assembly protein CpaF